MRLVRSSNNHSNKPYLRPKINLLIKLILIKWSASILPRQSNHLQRKNYKNSPRFMILRTNTVNLKRRARIGNLECRKSSMNKLNKLRLPSVNSKNPRILLKKNKKLLKRRLLPLKPRLLKVWKPSKKCRRHTSYHRLTFFNSRRNSRITLCCKLRPKLKSSRSLWQK